MPAPLKTTAKKRRAKAASAATVVAPRALLSMLGCTVALSFYGAMRLEGVSRDATGRTISSSSRRSRPASLATRRMLRDRLRSGGGVEDDVARPRSHPFHVSYVTPVGAISEDLPYRYERLPFSLDLRSGINGGAPDDDEEGGARYINGSSSSSALARGDEPDKDGCVPMREWMVRPVPTACNPVLEIDMVPRPRDGDVPSVQYVNAGTERSAWRIEDGLDENGKVAYRAIKTLIFGNAMEPVTFERSRHDALVMERLTSSPYISSIYGFCSTSQIVDYASGSVHDLMKEWRLNNEDYAASSLDRMRIGAQISSGIADLHTFEGDGATSIVHNDLCCHQIIRVGDVYKINDFHLAKFLRKDADTGDTCLEEVPFCMQKICSPEQYDGKAEGKKVFSPPTDVFAMGNILYYLLTNQWIFQGVSDVDARRKLRNGERSPYPDWVVNTSDPAEVALRRAIDMCWVHDPKKRPGARDVSEFLVEELNKLDDGLAQRERVVRVQNVSEIREGHRYTDSDYWRNLEVGMD